MSSRDLVDFEEMDMRSETVLRGVVEDQAALHGLLERIRDLGVELVDVRQVPNPAEPVLGPTGPEQGASPRHG